MPDESAAPDLTYIPAAPLNWDRLPPMNIRTARMPDVDEENPTRKRYRDMDPADIDDETVQAALGLIENENVQNRLVPLANGFINIPILPERLEARVFNLAYNGLQSALIYLFETIAAGGQVFDDLFGSADQSSA